MSIVMAKLIKIQQILFSTQFIISASVDVIRKTVATEQILTQNYFISLTLINSIKTFAKTYLW